MKNERKRNDCQFKPPVALEALKGLKTVQQIAKEFGIHPGQVSDWKKQLSEQAGSVFENGNNREVEGFDKEREGLHSKIGELIVQFDFAVNRYCLNTLLVRALPSNPMAARLSLILKAYRNYAASAIAGAGSAASWNSSSFSTRRFSTM